jgi:hypothetical protein
MADALYKIAIFLVNFVIVGLVAMPYLPPQRSHQSSPYSLHFWLTNWAGALCGIWVVASQARKKTKDMRENEDDAEAGSALSDLTRSQSDEAPVTQKRYPNNLPQPLIYAIDFVFGFIIGGVVLMPHLPPHRQNPLTQSDPKFWLTNWAGALLGIIWCGVEMIRVRIGKNRRDVG